MVDARAPRSARLVVARSADEPFVLRLRGRVDRLGAAELDAVAAEVLGTGTGPLVFDLLELESAPGRLVEVLNGIARRRLRPGGALVLWVHPDEVANYPRERLHPAIVVEPTTARLPAAPARTTVPRVKEAVAAGLPRREGAGFVASYGTGRSCDEPGCTTMLSRYNSRSVCFAHIAPER